ncbi:MAG: tetratricopeptide repeat protein [Negativicutes bacterium]|nr:tetratricopeptide repeat protein [Negativicutes bacterium]
MKANMFLQSGIDWAVKGDLHQAADAFRQAIELDRGCFEAHNNLGLVFQQLGCLREAEDCFRQVIELKPDCAAGYNNLGLVQKKADRLPEAVVSFSRAIDLDPEYSEAYNNLGIAQSEANRWEDAADLFCRAIELKPDNAETYFNLGIMQIKLKRPAEAAKSFCRATALNPKHMAAYFNLGVVQAEENRLDEAVAAFRRVIELNPFYYEAYNNLGALLRLADRLGEAEAALRRAIELKPDYAKAYNNLGLVLKSNHRLEEAETCLRHSIDLNPNDPETYNNLALVVKDAGRLADAESYLQQAIALRPDLVEAEFALGFLYLLQEQYEKGWGKYVKWQADNESSVTRHAVFQATCRNWQGEDLTGKKIVLFSDQGFGDAIQFIRYAPLVAKAAGQTSVWVQKPLQRLMAGAVNGCQIHPDENIAAGQYDFSCPLSSLPYLFHTSKDTIPQGIAYIRPVDKIISVWSERLGSLDGNQRYRIGVVWGGNPNHENDRNRSIDFAVFNRLFDCNQASWVSLQVGKQAKDLHQMPSPVLDISCHLSDFAETAAVIANLDLVISVDSAVAHLAGAMGKPTWLLVPFNPDWRWQLNREDSPWYPTMRLFRQQGGGRWPEVLERVKQALVTELKVY